MLDNDIPTAPMNDSQPNANDMIEITDLSPSAVGLHTHDTISFTLRNVSTRRRQFIIGTESIACDDLEKLTCIMANASVDDYHSTTTSTSSSSFSEETSENGMNNSNNIIELISTSLVSMRCRFEISQSNLEHQ